ncbi:hypothetical protein [Serinibacter salmoneus]|uniref:Uncharacterized protein n=1 Tax=Serinibacter salmoneus TaxID=556530 RepID=A0A2A9D3V3_9MICO|nr:hypothetical protein [Serinibacter salmoneus]PFG20529.1 hypothetical protein ATL40_2132 [Serinibacter salmoneus]
MSDSAMRPHASATTRRTVLKGAAWSAPVVATSLAVPVAARASTQPSGAATGRFASCGGGTQQGEITVELAGLPVSSRWRLITEISWVDGVPAFDPADVLVEGPVDTRSATAGSATVESSAASGTWTITTPAYDSIERSWSAYVHAHVVSADGSMDLVTTSNAIYVDGPECSAS